MTKERYRMREFKFRAWIKSLNRMISNEQLIQASSGLVKAAASIIRVSNPMLNFDSILLPFGDPDLTIMQHTGVKDKKGTDIYEGDIVRWSEAQPVKRDHDQEDLVSEDFKVVFINGMFVAEYFKSVTPPYETFADFDSDDIEVIGNVHVNPELIETEA